MDDVEHKQLFDSIRAAQPINNGHQIRLSSALAIKAQIASYIRGMVTWHELMRPKRWFALARIRVANRSSGLGCPAGLEMELIPAFNLRLAGCPVILGAQVVEVFQEPLSN